jgi:hypothetical protein
LRLEGEQVFHGDMTGSPVFLFLFDGIAIWIVLYCDTDFHFSFPILFVEGSVRERRQNDRQSDRRIENQGRQSVGRYL